MAGKEGSGQTDLLSGWSCVVHRPSEDPEPSELPSTVDMAAFTSGLSVEPTPNATNEESCDSESDSESDSNNSGSDGSGSCSQTDSSDSESSSSSQESSSRSSSPEFSVTSSQTDGLRLKIATIRKSCTSSPKSEPPDIKLKDKVNATKTNGTLSSSSEDSQCTDSTSESSSDSEAGLVNKSDNVVKVSDSSNDKNVSAKKSAAKVVLKQVDKVEKRTTRSVVVASPSKLNGKSKARSKHTRKIASLPLSHGSTGSSSDSEDGSETDRTMLASCSLQEIRQEDLAAILPDQQECDAFEDFDCRSDKNSPHTGDGSGSDMELPQQAVNALILRTTESSSESESRLPPNPTTLYANNFLQQFVAQTQLLNIANSTGPVHSESLPNATQSTDTNLISTSELSPVKRKRGRPKKSSTFKLQIDDKAELNIEYCGNPNVSPDSGIQNSSDHVSSPEPSPSPNPKTKYNKEEVKTHSITRVQGPITSNSFDRVHYGSADRVLYPPRRKVGRPAVRKGPGRPPKHKIVLQDTKSSEVDANKINRISVKSDAKLSRTKGNKIIPVLTNNLETKPKIRDIQRKSKAPLLQEICDKVIKHLEYSPLDENTKNQRKPVKKVNNRVLLGTKNKVECLKTKYTTLKNAKVMHSKHNEKRHKKCKFKILKPFSTTSTDPKLNTEIDKLVLDFVKLCNISTTKPLKENVPETLKALKKVSKKRKTSEYNERKKKKQNPNNSFNKEASSNEQRLPLKKRHYHLSTNNETGPSEAALESSTIEKDAKNCSAGTKITEKPKNVNKNISSCEQNGEPVNSSLNNNDYTTTGKHKSGKVDVHINEAIEACITKYAGVFETGAKIIRSPKPPKAITKPEDSISHCNVETVETAAVKKEEVINTSGTSLTTTTPKKRHRLEVKNVAEITSVTDIIEVTAKNDKQTLTKSLETVVSELKAKRVTPTNEKKPESTVHAISRKKNRLEDLTLTLASKVNANLPSDLTETLKRKKDDFSSTTKKIKSDFEKLDSIITSDEPTGIFMPTIEVDFDLPTYESTVDLSKVKVEDFPIVNVENVPVRELPDVVVKTENGAAVLPFEASPRRRTRKRRAINRTGFPSVKKKKKRVLIAVVSPTLQEVTVEKVEERAVCDRVPQEGEKYSAFLQRTEKTNVADTILEKLQKCIVSTPNLTEQQIAKWNEEESMYELGFLRNGRPSSRLSMQKCRSKDVSPSLSIETRASDKRSDVELDELSLEARIGLCNGSKCNMDMRVRSLRYSSLQKRRLRDASPSSGSEAYSDKRVREEVSVSGDEGKRTRKASKWRKRFLPAGLFSDYYKENDEMARLRRTEAVPKRLTYKPEEHPYGLLPPPYHCGKFLRCRKISFLLPYDLWWQHTNSQLPGRDMVPSWNYRKIRTNVYNVKSNGGACEPQSCNCTNESECGDDCINRLVLAECPATHKCLNQRIQKHEWAPGIEQFMTVDKGWGVRTKLPIKSGDFILEYVGEVVSDNEFKERMATRYAQDTHHYCLHLDSGLVIDGHRMGSHGRFVNHSCEPNCEIQKWSVNGQYRMALFALRDIGSNEELTYDYNFSLFNPAEGQECKCGSVNCRGVIGGKSQRVVRQNLVSTPVPTTTPGRKGRPRKKKVKSKCDLNLIKEAPTTQTPALVFLPPPHNTTIPALIVKPFNNQQKLYIRDHHCFLLRNFNKSKQSRNSVSRPSPAPSVDSSTTFANNLNAITKPCNIKTRRQAQVEDDPELKKAAKLAGSLRELLEIVTAAKDEKNDLLCSAFVVLPSKRKLPDYYHRIIDPIDFTTIEKNITAGYYLCIMNFDTDVNKIFSNAIKYHGRTSDLGIAAARLRKIYCEAKKQNLLQLEEVLGKKLPASFIPTKKKGDEEDVIRCICGMYHDEGLMIQCERCLVWQHSECVRADAKTPCFYCERCVPRNVNYEIPLDEFTEHGHRYYMTLMRGDLQLRQGDTVYVLRDITIPGTHEKHNYKTIGDVKYADLDIFRIERLWKDKETGQRYAYGHHYLRPHETFHEPTRKFFPNEVMRVPLYEAVPVELIISHCWVLDINTYCKGRPIGASEDHIYICEYRVDKFARIFMKNSKTKICTKSYAFEKFDVRLKISRTYAPHDLDPTLVKPRGRKMHENENVKVLPLLPVHVPPVIRTSSEKKTRLNKILLNLLNKMPTKQALDVSYLLEGGRRRKKPVQK